MNLMEERREFELAANRSISMPVAGAIVWFVIALVSTQLSPRNGIILLLFGSGAIFPLAMLIATIRKEALISAKNPLARLMGSCVLMVNLLWVVHIPLFIYAPEIVPLSLGVGLGLHWVVYSWIVQHPLGVIHSVLRSLLVVLVWFVFPENRLLAIGISILIVYCVSIYQMLSRPIKFT